MSAVESGDALPMDRSGDLRSSNWLLAGSAALGAATPFLWSVEIDGRGWVAALPLGARRVLLGVAFVVSSAVFIALLISKVRAMLGHQPATIRFAADQLSYRGPLVPKTFVFERREIRGVWVKHMEPKGMIPFPSIEQGVMLKLTSGRLRSLPVLAGDTADRLASDIVRWSGATRQEDERM